MEHENNKDKIVRPETPKSEDPARLNDLNPDPPSDEIAADPTPKRLPEKRKQEPGKVPGAREGQDPGIQQKKRTDEDDQPTNPPHNENDGEVWATDEQGKADNAKA